MIPGWGGTQRLARAVGPALAKDLILTGRTIDAAEALRVGLVSAVYPDDELLDRVLETAASLAEKSPLALSAAKDAANRALQGDLGAGLSYEAILFAALFASDDQKEGMRGVLREARAALHRTLSLRRRAEDEPRDREDAVVADSASSEVFTGWVSAITGR